MTSSLIRRAHAAISSQSRKSPSGARNAATTARSANPSTLRSSRPGKSRCSVAPVRSTISRTSTASSGGGFGGSPIGPLWAFALDERGGTTRLLSRNRIALRKPSLGDRLGMAVMEPGSLVMERKMLLGIKERAERLVDEREPIAA